MSNHRFPSRNPEPPAPPAGGRKIARELFGLFLLFWGLLVLLSLVTYHQGDPSLNHVVSNPGQVKNGAGVFGANISGMLVDVFGFAAFVWPAVFLAWGAGFVSTWFTMPWWRWFGFLLLGGCLISLGAAWNLGLGDVRGGGILGMTLFRLSENTLGATGSSLLWFFLFFLSLELACGISWMSLLARGAHWVRAKLAEHDITWQTLPAMLTRVDFTKMPLPRLGRSASDTTGDVIPLLDIHTDDNEDDAMGAPEAMNRPYEAQNASGGTSGSAEAPAYRFDDAIFASPSAPGSGGAGGAGTGAGAAIHPTPASAPLEPAPHAAFPTPAPSRVSEGTVREHVTPDTTPRDSGFRLPSLPRMLSALKPSPAPALPEPFMAQPVASRSTPASVAPPSATQVVPCVPQAPTSGPAHPVVAPEGSHFVQPSVATQAPVFTQATGQTMGQMTAATVTAPTTAPTTAPAQSPPSLQSEPPRVKRPLALPSIDLLQAPQQSDTLPSREFMEDKGSRLMACLDDFGIKGELVRVTPGPVVTMFELKPAPGVKVARIANLSQDLALSLKAEAVRIQAPIPGSDTVGVEIPNEHRATVNFRNILESSEFTEAESLLTMALGKDIGGHPVVADLARMPHVLVAGATGAGKSVCLNSLLVSILYKATPDEVKLLLVDPKKIELAVYADLPHLVHPVVTETPLAKTALDWAVNEMSERYDLMGKLKVRNIAGYNEKLHFMGDTRPEGLEDLEPLPYLVIIIDELADLMMTGGKEVETSIVRLAQLARACGIHLIIATQRPSVDVVTGLIKANFPCRIAFQVANKYDSRTILDSVGAELLLGRGDMLFKPSGGKLRRLHGPFVSDDDVAAVVEYWKRQRAPSYKLDFSEWGTETPEAVRNLNIDRSASDDEDKYAAIVEFVREPGQRISISRLQRQFGVGYNKAAMFMERLEKDGVLEPAGAANRPRVVRPR